MNSHTLKITGLSELPSPLELEKTYTFTIQGEVNAIKKESSNDGSFIFVYSAKQITGEVASDDGKVIKITDRKSQSKKLRSQLVAIALDRGEDPEKFYKETMIKIRHHTLAILDFINGLEKL